MLFYKNTCTKDRFNIKYFLGDIMSYLVNLIKAESQSHKHINYEILIYTEGKGIFYSEGKNTAVFPGKITIIPPGVTHTTTFEDNLDRIYIQSEFNNIFNITSPVTISDNLQNEGMQLARIIYNNRFSKPEYVTRLIDAFAHFLLQSLKIDNETSTAIKDIINKIAIKFYDPSFNVTQLLNESGYTEDYIRARFKNSTGKTPVEFLTKIRIDHARYLIDIYKSSLSLSEIALMCGYNDYVYFSRRFKKIVGMSPQKYLKDENNSEV